MGPLRCPNPKCNQHLLQKSGDRVRLRLKGRMQYDEQTEKLTAQCYWCGTQITLPMKMELSPGPDRFVLKA